MSKQPKKTGPKPNPGALYKTGSNLTVLFPAEMRAELDKMVELMPGVGASELIRGAVAIVLMAPPSNAGDDERTQHRSRMLRARRALAAAARGPLALLEQAEVTSAPLGVLTEKSTSDVCRSRAPQRRRASQVRVAA